MKNLRFYLTWKPKSQPASETKVLMACGTSSHANIIFCFSYPPKKCHGSDTEGLGRSCTHNKVASQLRDPEFMEPKSFITGSKQTCPIFAPVEENIFMMVDGEQTCFLEKIIQNKQAVSVSVQKIFKKFKRPMGNYFRTSRGQNDPQNEFTEKQEFRDGGI